MHAVSDIGAMVDWLQEQVDLGAESKDNLAVLRNQNGCVDLECMPGSLSLSKKSSRSVTSCAGMTAYMVILAQTRIGFLSGGRGQKFIS